MTTPLLDVVGGYSATQQATFRDAIGAQPSSFGAERMKRWISWKTLQDYRYDLVCIGDSFTHGSYWTSLFRDLLLAESYPDGGPGWAGFGWAGASKVLRNSSIDAVELDYDLTEADWTNTYGNGGYGAAVEHLVATAADKVITITCGVALGKLQVMFLRSGTKPLYQVGSDGYNQLVNSATEYSSRFDLGDDGWTVYGGSLTSNHDSIGGRNNCLKLTPDTSTGDHIFIKYSTVNGVSYNVSYEVYIPTGSTIDKIQTRNAGPIAEHSVPLDTWTAISDTFTANAGYFRFRLGKGGSYAITTAATDIVYVRNVVLTETTPQTAIGLGDIDVSAAGSSFTVSLKSASNTTTLLGVIGRTATATALCVHKLGSSGGNASMFDSSTYWDDSVALILPKGAIIMFGTNEQYGGTTPATYATTVQSLIDKLRAITPSIDILLACPGATKYGNTSATTYPLSEYRDVLRRLAIANDCAFLDFLDSIGPWSSQLVTDTFVHADEVHPGTRGKHVYANLFHGAFSK